MQKLDPSQRAFIEAPAGRIRLLAPAGCGKTLCLLYRCKHLAEKSSSSRQRFLIVTFTRAAREELRRRLNEERDFAGLRDQIEVATLNSWGFRRMKNVAHSPNLIISRKEYHFTMANLLQPIWQEHERVKAAIKNSNRWKSSNAPRKLMETINALKSLGFDHVRHRTFADFSRHWKDLEEQGLGWRLDQQVDQLIRFEVLDEKTDSNGLKNRRQEFFDAFFGFWLAATERLIASATFTFED